MLHLLFQTNRTCQMADEMHALCKAAQHSGLNRSLIGKSALGDRTALGQKLIFIIMSLVHIDRVIVSTSSNSGELKF